MSHEMPVYNGVKVSVQAQYDTTTIPEFASPMLASQFANEPPDEQDQSEHGSIIHHHSIPIFDVYVQSCPNSQFWVAYEVDPEIVRITDPRTAYVYFKLFINGNVVKWGIGDREHWSGKTMFALCQSGRTAGADRVIEKKGLFFGAPSDAVEGEKEEEGVIEVKIYRARARKRVGSVMDSISRNEGQKGVE